MEIVLIVLIFCIVFFLLTAVVLNTDFAALKNRFFERNVDDLLDRAYNRKYHGKVMLYIEQSIVKSNIKFYIKFYGVLLHLLISTGVFLIFYVSNFLSNYFIVKVSFGLIGFFIPFIVLKLMGYLMESRVKKQSIVWMTGVRNYNRTINDIFKAFEFTIDSTPEPLSSYTKSMVLKHKAKISQAKCLNDFQANVGQHSELGLFIDNLKLSIYEGADVNRLIEEYISDMEKLYEIEDGFVAEEIAANVAVYFLIAIVILGVRVIYTISYTSAVVNELWHQLAVSLSLFVSLLIIVKSLRR